LFFILPLNLETKTPSVCVIHQSTFTHFDKRFRIALLLISFLGPIS
jgi:hypothetical protein